MYFSASTNAGPLRWKPVSQWWCALGGSQPPSQTVPSAPRKSSAKIKSRRIARWLACLKCAYSMPSCPVDSPPCAHDTRIARWETERLFHTHSHISSASCSVCLSACCHQPCIRSYFPSESDKLRVLRPASKDPRCAPHSGCPACCSSCRDM